MKTILCSEWLIDGTEQPPLRRQAVAISDGQIVDVQPADAVQIQEGDQRVDLGNTTLIPGLINSHVHLVLPGDNTPFEAIQLESDIALAMRAAHNAAVSLRGGVTTVRDCGGRRTTVLELRTALAASQVPGARVISCGWPITITGGHCRYFGGEADGEEDLRRMVRALVSSGADFIKVLASGGGTPGSLSQYPSYTLGEMTAIVTAAHALGRPVAAHCIATESIAIAIQAGVDWIEHGLFVEPDGVARFSQSIAEQLAASQIPVVTTMQVARDMNDRAIPGAEGQRWRSMLERDREIKARLRDLGVPFVAGSDAGWRATGYDTFGRELEELVKIGMSPVEAIHAATGRAAVALGLGDQIGSIQPGRRADLVAVAGNLAFDIGAVSDVKAVFQSGLRVV